MKTPAVYFFDMDHTLINNDCDVSWKQFAVRHNLAPESDLAEADRYFDDYNAGTLDVEEFYLFQFREFIGKTPEEMRPLSELHFEEYVRPHIYPEARKLVGSLLDAGFPVAILTSTNSVVAQPLAECLGIREVLGTTLELEDGRYTGRITGHLRRAGGQGRNCGVMGGRARVCAGRFRLLRRQRERCEYPQCGRFPVRGQPGLPSCSSSPGRRSGRSSAGRNNRGQSSSMPKVSARSSRSTGAPGRFSPRSPEKSSDWSTPRSTKKSAGSSSSRAPMP